MSNITERDLFCSRHWDGQSAYLFHWYKGFTAFFVPLSIAVTLCNLLILVALNKDTSLHPPSKLLFRNLTITDFCVGIIAIPAHIAFISSTMNERWDLCRFLKYFVYVISTILSGVSLGTLCGISVDRLLALLLGLRYRQVMTLKRMRIAVVCLWIMSTTDSLLYIWNMQVFFIASAALISILVAIPTYCYAKILRTIRRKKAQVNDIVHGSTKVATPNLAKYKKTVYSALWVHVTLVACFLPFSVVITARSIRGLSTSIFLAEGIAVTMVNMNSLLNPALYCWKIKEIRRAVRDTIRQLCPGLYAALGGAHIDGQLEGSDRQTRS